MTARTNRTRDRGQSTIGPRDRGQSNVGPRDRGQSNVDYVIGFGVFFLAFTFVLTLLPELLSPFAAPEGTVVADRAVETLTGDLLASGTVGSLNETCTAEFFRSSGTSCSFDASDPTPALLGVTESHSLNVTLDRNLSDSPGPEVVCYDGTAVLDCANGGDPLARGGSPPANTQSVRTVRRVVRFDGETLVLTLRTW